MGKGDMKTGRGKRKAGSYGKTRRKKTDSAAKIPVTVLDKNEKPAPKEKVKKELPEQTDKTENAEVSEKPKATKKKKTEE